MLLWHGTFTINSLSHVFGTPPLHDHRHQPEQLAARAHHLGEGWHNNHHYYQSTANQGLFWWEIDMTYYVLRALSWVGLVWDLRTPPAAVKYAYLKYTDEERAELRRTPALFGESRRAVVQAARRAVQRASELQLSAPSTAPVLRR